MFFSVEGKQAKEDDMPVSLGKKNKKIKKAFSIYRTIELTLQYLKKTRLQSISLDCTSLPPDSPSPCMSGTFCMTGQSLACFFVIHLL